MEKNRGSKVFSTKAIWELIRSEQNTIDWYRGVWFPYATPKYSFITWLAIHDRLTTGQKLPTVEHGVKIKLCVLWFSEGNSKSLVLHLSILSTGMEHSNFQTDSEYTLYELGPARNSSK